ncbi:PLD nuclease N-terminal domain-containing protein [Clostridium estertheticum]|uniref:PLD nuclease N-terminal domain-containing protein n=1 Tax=Clostridium estertheticum TaxID=238834 RepID=A0AA47I744_9CLOT|nr:PLD nuclease N-terminal domain-containing protein [Clostridium estertheticum]MBU3155517.1 PLD nuclease N-terminal domain-containing protein [Clostridium estertheticum]MBU3198042.1 PLD nuclease N-terminal domain-containing protein [Clostridium estertheticum]WAG60084.1 PLD nuclease N-terminal domain-containing protein [Clostridium estertheticum]WAG65837.1 PLD nuclease N-terminal domain-containing protein [Clostridium estertheticum]
MGNLTTIELLKTLLPLIIIQLSLMFFCLLKLSKDNVKYFPKWLWSLIIIFGELLGPIAYLLLGRERS